MHLLCTSSSLNPCLGNNLSSWVLMLVRFESTVLLPGVAMTPKTVTCGGTSSSADFVSVSARDT